MKRTLTIFALSVILFNSAFAGGKEKEVLTLSKGRYVEVFDQDSVEQIGNILYNVNSRQIVGFVTGEEIDNAASLQPEVISRWMQIDPLAEKYYSLSPYAFCANNPIRFVDTDGREIKIAGTAEFRTQALTFLQSLTNDKLSMNDDGVVSISSAGTANEGKNFGNGTALVSYLVGNDNKNTIEETKGDNSTDSKIVRNKEGEEVRRYAEVKFNPYRTKAGKDVEGNNERPVKIGIAHELIHVKRNNNRTEVNEPSNVPNPDSPGFNLNKDEVDTRKEENQIRRENNLPDRIKEEQ